MLQLIRESNPVAKKAYNCVACEYIREFLNQGYFTISDYRKIVKAKRQGWKIQPGQRYVKQVQVDGRELITYRAIPEMDELCNLYDLWPDW